MRDRRNFIKNIARGTVVLSLSGLPLTQCFTLNKKDKIGVGLVGLGYYSTDLLAPALQLTGHCYLAGIVIIVVEAIQKSAKEKCRIMI